MAINCSLCVAAASLDYATDIFGNKLLYKNHHNNRELDKMHSMRSIKMWNTMQQNFRIQCIVVVIR